MKVSAWMSVDVDRRDGELIFASRSPMPFLNGVMREDATGDASALLERARTFFFGRGRGFVVLAWPGDPDLRTAAENAGMFPVLERYPEMVCRARLPHLAADIQPVTDLPLATEY